MSPSTRSRVRQTATALLVLLALGLGAAPVSPAAAAPAAPAAGDDPVPAVDAALDWLAAEVVASDGMLQVVYGDVAYDDAGLTLDAVLALAAGGRGDSAAVAAARGALEAALDDYVTGFAGGDARSAGAVAKTLLAELVLGVDVSPAYDLEADLRSLMATEGEHTGRFQDREGFGDFSNGLGQAFAVLALARTDGEVPAPAVSYLLAQQCADGSFRLYYDEGSTCADPAEGDPDATALAVMALLEVPGGDEVATAVEAAVAHLLAQQGPDGGVTGTGAENANTTGLAAAALRAAGQTAAADAAAAFVRSLQWTVCGADLGAVAYDAAAHTASTAAGALVDRSQWSRATSQGALALGLPAYGDIGVAAPVPAGTITCQAPAPPATEPPPTPPPATDPVIDLAHTSLLAGEVLDATARGFEPGEVVVATLHSTPRVLGSVVADDDGAVAFAFTIPADLEPGVHTLVLTGETSGRTASAPVEVLGRAAPGTLPVTGASTGLAGAGVALVLVGLGLQRAAAARRGTAG